MTQPSPERPRGNDPVIVAVHTSGWAGDTRLRRGVRTGIIVLAIVGIVLGVVAIVWPDATLVTVAVLFGGYLVLTGIARVAFAARARPLGSGLRWVIGAIGAVVTVAGVLLLLSPAASLVILAMLLGAGWFLEGLSSIITGALDSGLGLRWWAVLSGVIGCIAGITVLILPAAALQAFVIVGGSLLVAISLSLLIIALQRVSVSRG